MGTVFGSIDDERDEQEDEDDEHNPGGRMEPNRGFPRAIFAGTWVRLVGARELAYGPRAAEDTCEREEVLDKVGDGLAVGSLSGGIEETGTENGTLRSLDERELARRLFRRQHLGARRGT